MEHQARDSGLGLEPEIEQQQQESQLREEVIDEQDERKEELRGPQGELEELQERQEEVREDRFDQPPVGHTIRIITPSPVEHATQEPRSVVHEVNRPVRVQSPVLSDAARRERELPRVPVSEESNTDSSAQVNPSNAAYSNSHSRPLSSSTTSDPAESSRRQGTPPLTAYPAFAGTGTNQQSPQMREQSYRPPGGEPMRSMSQLLQTTIPMAAQNYIYQHTPQGSVIGDIAAATVNTGAQHLGGEVKGLESNLQSELGRLGAQLDRNPSFSFVKDVTAAAIGGATGAAGVSNPFGAGASAQNQPNVQQQPGHAGLFADLASTFRPILVGAAAEAGAHAGTQIAATAGHLQEQVQHPGAGAHGFFSNLTGNFFGHGHGAQNSQQLPYGAVSIPAATAGNAGVGAGPQRQATQNTRSSTRPLSSNASITHSPTSLVDERGHVILTAPPIRERDRERSSMPGQYLAQTQGSLPPTNGNYSPPRGGGGTGGGGTGSREDDRLSRHRSQRSHLDWIVPSLGMNGNANGPADEKTSSHRTNHKGHRLVRERLDPTLEAAIQEEIRVRNRAVRTGYTLNIAIGLQVLLNALVTGLSASGTSGLAVAVLGGAGTVIASYLARARGTNEPQTSEQLASDLQKFIRDIKGFIEDHGDTDGNDYDGQIIAFRERYEELLGNATAQDGKLRAQRQPGPDKA